MEISSSILVAQRRCGNRIFGFPSFIQSGFQSAKTHRAAFIINPVHQASGFTKRCNETVLRGIALVLAITNPAAIVGFVISIVINTINLKIWRIAICISPISKTDETISPLFADRNTTSTIACIHAIVGIVASAFHGMQNSIETSAIASSFVMRTWSFTTTTLGMTIEQGGYANRSCISAATSARYKPFINAICSSRLWEWWANNCPSNKGVAYLDPIVIGRICLHGISSFLSTFYHDLRQYVNNSNNLVVVDGS